MTGSAISDAAGVASGVIVDVAGYRAVVRSASGETRRALRLVFSGFRCEGAADAGDLPAFHLDDESGLWRVRSSGDIVHEGRDFLVALGTLEYHVLSAALDDTRDRFQMHGAALCAPARPAGVVISGDSGIGKTTLALALMHRGFTPFSDDVAMIEPDTLHLSPLRRAFHINADTYPMLEPLAGGLMRGEPDGLPGYFVPPQWATQPVPVRWLLFPERAEGRAPCVIPLPPAEAASAILGQSGTLAVAARLALGTTAKLVEQARCYRLVSGDLTETVTVIQKLILAD